MTHTQSVGLLWTADRPVTETSTSQHTALTTDRHPFEPAIPTNERPHTHTLELAARDRPERFLFVK
jgi:hypothetical protein